MLPHWDVLTDYMSLLAGLSVSKDAFLSPSPSCSGSDSETQNSPEIISKFNIVLMLTLCVCKCVYTCVSVRVCMHEQFMSLCVSAWRQDRLSEPNSPDAALEVEFHFKGSIR